ncbi:MAG: bifunctional phosphoribosyl-AMP cyclohydrolase/phosphoribosyl-ATP diphosphatase HisIE [Candidatus Rokubacteria bacterium]|nr:bifunctional phosphoribosyl-AMP cyclohydrolase/phosphoribosyl-ATP diphosphatase HisIE [Candidatus Rokubacteria bacterium]
MSEPDRDLVFDAQGLIPAVVQEARTGEVLMVAWMNAETLRKTLETRRAHFWSRSRQALWEKGATSGHHQHVEAVYADCDRDTLLLLVHQEGVACHTGSRTCFFTRLDAAGAGPGGWEAVGCILDVVERVIQSRKAEPKAGSYVSGLLAEGDAGILKKIGEESVEVIVASVAESRERLVAEVADLWFHTLVLLGARGIALREVFAELAKRHQPRGVPGG